MKYPITRVIPQSDVLPFPKDLFLRGEFKSLVNKLVHSMGIAKKFKPRLYTYADFVNVKIYALISGLSTEIASEKLNAWMERYFIKKFSLCPKKFADNYRHRRFIPHQTDVDKFFRLLSLKDVQNLFGNLLTRTLTDIQKRTFTSAKMRFLVDNTEYAYYGKKSSAYEIGTNRKAGTRLCRLFQGHALHGCGMTLFSDFFLLAKGKYRAANIPMSTKYLRWLGINLSYALMDREFYRAALIKDLKTKKLGVIIPAKKYPRVRRSIIDYLLGRRLLSDKYYFSQRSGAKPWPSSVHFHLVVVGKDDKSAASIRQSFRKGLISYDEALTMLSGFFTTLRPWKNLNQWARWLTKTYKKRWNEETAFVKINEIHRNYRNRYPTVQLAQLFLRGIVFNSWQHFKKLCTEKGIRPSRRTLSSYLMRVRTEIEKNIRQNVRSNTFYLQKEKRRLFFEV